MSASLLCNPTGRCSTATAPFQGGPALKHSMSRRGRCSAHETVTCSASKHPGVRCCPLCTMNTTQSETALYSSLSSCAYFALNTSRLSSNQPHPLQHMRARMPFTHMHGVCATHRTFLCCNDLKQWLLRFVRCPHIKAKAWMDAEDEPSPLTRACTYAQASTPAANSWATQWYRQHSHFRD